MIHIHKGTATAYTVRTKVLDGKSYIVAPVVMMVEGVHTGSKGAVFHSIEELGKYPNTWDGMPVLVKHPMDDSGNYISANSLSVVEDCIGRVYNTRVDGTRLKAEVYIDKDKAAKKQPSVLAYINQNKKLEVSVGVFTDAVMQDGEWEGEAYKEIAINHRPDHLALLPGDVGACSWEDGCGIRTNSKGVINTNSNNLITDISEEMVRQFNNHGYRIEPMVNSLSYGQRMDAINAALPVGMKGDFTYIEELYSDYVIYQVSPAGNGKREFFKQTYNILADGTVEMTGNPVKVSKQISYINVNKKEKIMDNKKKPCCEEKVNQLIANSATKWGETDREWLLEQDETTLEKLIPEPQKSVEMAKPVTVNLDQVREVMKGIKDVETHLEMMPDAMRDQMQSALAVHTAQRAHLINKITTNAKDIWETKDLEAMGTGVLTKIAATFPAEKEENATMYMGNPISVNQETEEILLPNF